jgi:hypothetical protein
MCPATSAIDLVDRFEPPASDIALAETFAQRRRENDPVVRQLHRYFTRTLYGLTLETVGLGAAAALGS